MGIRHCLFLIAMSLFSVDAVIQHGSVGIQISVASIRFFFRSSPFVAETLYQIKCEWLINVMRCICHSIWNSPFCCRITAIRVNTQWICNKLGCSVTNPGNLIVHYYTHTHTHWMNNHLENIKRWTWLVFDIPESQIINLIYHSVAETCGRMTLSDSLCVVCVVIASYLSRID